jgi:CIC family chloride channel protein
MGAVFAGTIRAPITSVLIIIEMTGGYGLTLPLMIANMMSYGLARQLRPTPIYEAFLEQDGIQLHAKKPVVDAIDKLTIERVKLALGPHVTFAANDGAARLLEVVTIAGRQDVFPVLDGDKCLVGIITLEDLTALAAEPDLGGLVCAADIMRPPVALRPHELVNRALDQMMSIGVRELPVVDDNRRLVGLVDEAAIAHEFMRARRAARVDPAVSGVHVLDVDDVR